MQFNHHQMRDLLRLSTNKPPKNTSLIHLDVVLLTVLCGSNSSVFFLPQTNRGLAIILHFPLAFYHFKKQKVVIQSGRRRLQMCNLMKCQILGLQKRNKFQTLQSFFNVQNGVEKVFFTEFYFYYVLYGSPFPQQNKIM